MSPLHDRMPVALPAEEWDTWLDPNQHDKAQFGANTGERAAEPVSRYVSNARNQGPECIKPV
jgi:putative SOS response-associated peptidase YedK